MSTDPASTALSFEIVSVQDDDRKIILCTKNPCRKIIITAKVVIDDCDAADCYDMDKEYMPFLHRPGNLRDLVGHSLKHVTTVQAECTQFDITATQPPPPLSPHTRQAAHATVTITTNHVDFQIRCNEDVPLDDYLMRCVVARAHTLEAYEYPPESLHIVLASGGYFEQIKQEEKVEQLLAQFPNAVKWDMRGKWRIIPDAVSLKQAMDNSSKKKVIMPLCNDMIDFEKIDGTDYDAVKHELLYNSWQVQAFKIINPETAFVVHFIDDDGDFYTGDDEKWYQIAVASALAAGQKMPKMWRGRQTKKEAEK